MNEKVSAGGYDDSSMTRATQNESSSAPPHAICCSTYVTSQPL
jgi:hypothetical protein